METLSTGRLEWDNLVEPRAKVTMSITTQPPARTLYQRLLRPSPQVTVSPCTDDSKYLVEAALVKASSGHKTGCLEGTCIANVENGFAEFKRLKITSTSQQQKTLFKLRFELKCATSSGIVSAEMPHVYSTPIEVFSHPLYLHEDLIPAIVSEVIPAVVSLPHLGRIAIIGSGFVDKPNLCVMVGDTRITPHFHENTTLVATLSTLPTGTLPVRVSLDGEVFSEQDVSITVVDPSK